MSLKALETPAEAGGEPKTILGVPQRGSSVAVPPPPPGTGSASSVQADAVPTATRAPEQSMTLGTPWRPRKFSPLGPTDTDLFDESAPVPEDEAAEALLEEEAGHLNATGRMLDPVVVSLVVVFSGLALLFLAAQALSAWTALASLPAPFHWFGYGGVLLVSTAVLAAVGFLVVQFARLRPSPRVSLAALDEIRDRARTRQAALRKTTLAQKQLEQFLNDYPLEAGNACRLSRLGFSEAEAHRLIAQKQQLCESARSSDRTWIEDVEKRFVCVLDEVAARRIRRYALLVGIKTAAAPTGFLDTAIVLINAYLLVGDLCRIYNVRTTRWSTLLVLVHIFVNAVAASRMEDVTEPLGENLADSLREEIGGVFARAAGIFGSRTAEGTVNGLLLARLGHATKRRLRPIVLERKAA
jgi:uncharacterized membrane protein YcjF (UPF0283 family)